MVIRKKLIKSHNPLIVGSFLAGARPKTGSLSDPVNPGQPITPPAVAATPGGPKILGENTVPVIVRRYYTTVDGTILDKNDVSIPAGLKVAFPVYVFSQFDRNGGFKKSLQVRPPQGISKYYMSFVQGINSMFLSFTGFNDMMAIVQPGDVVEIFTDNLQSPNFFVWIVMSCESVSLASITANTESMQPGGQLGSLYLKEFNYSTDNENQFNQPIFYVKYDTIGNYTYDQLNPNQQLTPNVQQPGFLRIPAGYKLDQYIGVNFFMNFEANFLQMDFIVNKI